jgi:hypothetical protein
LTVNVRVNNTGDQLGIDTQQLRDRVGFSVAGMCQTYIQLYLIFPVIRPEVGCLAIHLHFHDYLAILT